MLDERFTDQAREVIGLAREEAANLRHDHIGTEHILLGLLRSKDVAVERVMGSLGLTAGRVNSEVRRLVGEGERPVSGEIPFTPRAKAGLEIALRESGGRRLVEPRDLLLGIAAEGEGVGARILRESDADLGQMRRELSG